MYNPPNMSPEMQFDDIPEEFQSLYIGSARNVLSIAHKMISAASEEKQKEYLEDDLFCKALNSAFFNLDQRGREERIKVVSSFRKHNQPFAFKTFIGGSN